MSANRDLVIVVEFGDSVENNYSEICNIIECVKDLRVPHSSNNNKNPYSFYTKVRCENFTYMILSYSLVRTDAMGTPLYNTIAAKNGVGLTDDEKEFIFEEIESIFMNGSFNAVLNGDLGFENRTYETISEKYHIPVANLKEIYNEYYYYKYH